MPDSTYFPAGYSRPARAIVHGELAITFPRDGSIRIIRGAPSVLGVSVVEILRVDQDGTLTFEPTFVSGDGPRLTAPNASRWRVEVDNSGILTTVAL